LSNSVMIVAENLFRRRKAMSLMTSGENGGTSKESAKRSDFYTFGFLDSALRIFPLLVRSLRLERYFKSGTVPLRRDLA
jgi:hypothetical protein